MRWLLEKLALLQHSVELIVIIVFCMLVLFLYAEASMVYRLLRNLAFKDSQKKFAFGRILEAYSYLI